MLTFDFDTKAYEAQMNALKAKTEAALRPAAQAGAQVYYEAVKATVPTSNKGRHRFYGTASKEAIGTEAKKLASYWYDQGNLKASIYQVYSDAESNKEKAVYHVAWNHKKAPYGFMVALGTVGGAKANDFIGNARKSVQQKALDAMKSAFESRMKKS